MNDPISEEDLVKTDSKCFFIRVAGWLGEQTIFNPKLTRDLAIRVGIIINFFSSVWQGDRNYTRILFQSLFIKFEKLSIFSVRNSCNALRQKLLFEKVSVWS